MLESRNSGGVFRTAVLNPEYPEPDKSAREAIVAPSSGETTALAQEVLVATSRASHNERAEDGAPRAGARGFGIQGGRRKSGARRRKPRPVSDK